MQSVSPRFVHPEGQSPQVRPPAVLIHVRWLWHPPLFARHSFTSKNAIARTQLASTQSHIQQNSWIWSDREHAKTHIRNASIIQTIKRNVRESVVMLLNARKTCGHIHKHTHAQSDTHTEINKLLSTKMQRSEWTNRWGRNNPISRCLRTQPCNTICLQQHQMGFCSSYDHPIPVLVLIPVCWYAYTGTALTTFGTCIL